MENIRKPQILIQTDGITNTKIFIDGKELPYVLGCVSTLYIQNRSVLSKTQEKAFDKVVKIL